MDDSIRVMVELGKKRRVVACAFDWPGWDRSGKTEEDALRVLAAYRPRYAKVAALAGLADEFDATGELAAVERVQGNGMTDYYGVSGRSAEPEKEQMSEAACERKIVLLRASWTYFDDVASRVSAELKKGPRGGGREQGEIVRHVNGTEIQENARKVGVGSSPDAWRDPDALRAHREALCSGIREFNARGPSAGSWWTVQSSSGAPPGTCSTTRGRRRTGTCPGAPDGTSIGSSPPTPTVARQSCPGCDP
jgi:hypothetical protein